MSPSDLLPAATDDDNALRSLLNHAVSYEKAGAVIPFDLMRFGLLGSVVVIGTGLLALILPDADSVRHSGFYLVLGGLAADTTFMMKALAIPAIFFGMCLLALDVYLMNVRTSDRSRSIVVAQAAMGGAGGAICTVFLALAVLNLVIWITLIVLGLVLLGVFLSALAAGG
jgi:hypothetical protein